MTHDDSTPGFDALGLAPAILATCKTLGYTKPSPIQALAVPSILEGSDLVGCARTGTGKTAAFAMPIVQRFLEQKRRPLPREPRCLVMTPTRELAAQVEETFRTFGAYAGVSSALAFGGVGKMPQAKAIAKGADVLVATPGRLLDLHGDGHLSLAKVEVFVLDEADRMLDMGFLRDMRKVFALLPADRQTLLFSATMTSEVENVIRGITRSAKRVAADPVSSRAERIAQRVIMAEKDEKKMLLPALLRKEDAPRALIFSRTKHLADRLAKLLVAEGIPAAALHANKSQNNRTATLARFKDGGLRALIATDIASRGIDIEELPLVINYDLPDESETYVHRIGRTARAGASGKAVSFCSAEEQGNLRAIEKLLGERIERDDSIPMPERSAAVNAAVEDERRGELVHGPNGRSRLARDRKLGLAPPRQAREPSAGGRSRRSESATAAPADARGRQPRAEGFEPRPRDPGQRAREQQPRFRDQRGADDDRQPSTNGGGIQRGEFNMSDADAMRAAIARKDREERQRADELRGIKPAASGRSAPAGRGPRYQGSGADRRGAPAPRQGNAPRQGGQRGGRDFGAGSFSSHGGRLAASAGPEDFKDGGQGRKRRRG